MGDALALLIGGHALIYAGRFCDPVRGATGVLLLCDVLEVSEVADAGAAGGMWRRWFMVHVPWGAAMKRTLVAEV